MTTIDAVGGLDSADPPAPHGTRWRRTAPLLVLALGVVTGLTLMLRNDVLAAAVTYQGTTAQFSTGRVSGEDVGFAMTRMETKSASGQVQTRQVLRAGFATANLDGFCLSQVQSVPLLGSVTVKVTAGDGSASTREIEAVNVQFDVVELKGSGTGVNLDGVVQIGLAGQDVTTLPDVANPLDAPLGTGWFGIDATAGDIYEARGTIYNAEIGGPMQLPGLKITVVPGGSQCSADALPH